MAADKTIMNLGFKLIVRTGSVMTQVQKAVESGLYDVAKQYKKQIIENISLDDHTLEELRKLGHPYKKAGGMALHGDDRLVHEQSGKLKRSIRLEPVSEVRSKKFSSFISSGDPKLPFLIYGTSTMRARRFHEKAYEDLKGVFWDPLYAQLKKVKV